MTRDQIKDILERVKGWPAERQADIARVAELMEEQDKAALALDPEQAAEVRRRLDTPAGENIPAARVFERLRSKSA